jgi:hypothetical protein
MFTLKYGRGGGIFVFYEKSASWLKSRYSCTECPYPVIFARKSGLLGHTRKYHSSLFKVENVYN